MLLIFTGSMFFMNIALAIVTNCYNTGSTEEGSSHATVAVFREVAGELSHRLNAFSNLMMCGNLHFSPSEVIDPHA